MLLRSESADFAQSKSAIAVVAGGCLKERTASLSCLGSSQSGGVSSDGQGL